jgi:hypothetical protein
MTTNNIPKGWCAAGSHPGDYWMGVDATASKPGAACATLKSKVPEASGFGTLMQTILADDYRGQRVRLSADVRAERVEGWAGLWLRVDAQGRPVRFDNMQDRAVTGTAAWARHGVVLDVPPESDQVAFGLLLAGTGQVWMRELRFEAVGKEVPTTEPRQSLPSQPVNLSFEDAGATL